VKVEPRASKPGLWVNPDCSEGDPGLFAVVLGVSRYRHLADGEEEAPETYGLGQLKVSALTAFRVFRWLVDQYYVDGCPLAKCWLLLAPTDDECNYEPGLKENLATPTFANCENAIASWYENMRGLSKSAAKRSRAFFFFSGHGLEIHQERQVLLSSDYLSPPARNWDRAISTPNLRFGLASLKVPRQFFFLDACRNDHKELRKKNIRGIKILPEDESALVDSSVVAPVFYATASGQMSFQQPDPNKRLSLFGTALLDGFCGKPDIELVEAGAMCSVNLYPLQEYVEDRIVELLVAVDAEVSQPVKLSGTVRNEAITFLKRPPFSPGRVPPPRRGGESVTERIDKHFTTRGARVESWDTDFSAGHAIFGSEHVTEIWSKRLRLFDSGTRQPLDSKRLQLHTVEWSARTLSYRIEFSIKKTDAFGYWFGLTDTANVNHGCVLSSDYSGPERYSGQARYLVEFDIAHQTEPGGGRRITRLEATLALQSEGLLRVAAKIWHMYRTANLEDAVHAVRKIPPDDRLVSLDDSREHTRLVKLQERIQRALIDFRPGGLFASFSGFETGLHPYH
jgi:hypothetical protein